ncbi:MAG: hypothetical protein M3264_00875 [Thermoproteota archaeon]|nr:hypothetical protein [Thermoproteota archaeon]
MSIDIITHTVATVDGGFLGGLLFGFAIKKVIKLIAVIAGSFVHCCYDPNMGLIIY